MTQPWKGYAAGSEIAHFADFCKEHLVQSVDEWDGKPLLLEPWQRNEFGEALAYDDKGWPYWSSIVLCLPRKNGKTIMLAAYAIYRLLTSDGSPEILFAAASDKQAGRLFDYAATFVRRSAVLSELCRVRDYIGEIRREDGEGVILRMASDPGKLHGYNPSLVVCDELAQWTTPTLRRAYAALTTGGGARSAPQVFTITTAGEASTRHDSILGRILDAAEDDAETERDPGLTIGRLHEARTLVFNHEAPTTDPADVEAMKLANPASWITSAYLARQAADPELTDADVLQLHGCVWAEAETTFVGPQAIIAARSERLLADGERVVLSFDGSERRDETWLTACTLDGFVQPLARWQRPKSAPEEWRIPRHEVHQAVEAAFGRYKVLELAADPPGWYTELDSWADLYGEERVLAFETKQPKRMAPACEKAETAFNEAQITYGGPLAKELSIHLGNCVRRETPFGTVVSKEHQDSPRKIDGAVTLIIGFDRAMWQAANWRETKPMVAVR